jgi:hypothetical protein
MIFNLTNHMSKTFTAKAPIIGPTDEQNNKISQLKQEGYKFDKILSCRYAAVVMSKGDDIWVFGVSDGSIHHNPDTLIIKTSQ